MRAWTDISLPSRHRTPPHQPTPIPVPSALSRADRPSPPPSPCAPLLSCRHGGHAGVFLPSVQWRDTQPLLAGVPCHLVCTQAAAERSAPSSPETGGSCGRIRGRSLALSKYLASLPPRRVEPLFPGCPCVTGDVKKRENMTLEGQVSGGCSGARESGGCGRPQSNCLPLAVDQLRGI